MGSFDRDRRGSRAPLAPEGQDIVLRIVEVQPVGEVLLSGSSGKRTA
jgi:hypothetical protein